MKRLIPPKNSERRGPGRPETAKTRFWRRVLADWQRSGESISAYCRRYRLSRDQFSYWREILKVEQDSHPAETRPALLPVQVVHGGSPWPPPTGRIEIELRYGRTLSFAGEFDESMFAKVIRVLEDTP